MPSKYNFVMRIVTVDDKIIQKLRESGLSKEMKSLENCDFLVIIEHDEKIVGAGGIGGFFHVPSLQIHPAYMNKGLGGKIFDVVVKEAKRQKYSFIVGSRNPQNLNAVRLHDFYGLRPVFQIKYSPEFTRDVVIMDFNRRGKLVVGFLKIFNNLLGMSILVCALKILKKLLFKVLLTYPPEEFPSPDIKYAIKNFKKL